MRARLQQLLYRVRGSYWFVPGVMAVAAILLSYVSVQLDRRYGDLWVAQYSWLVPNQPDGARALLATVAGSMITVAGVTFSLTILAVSYATSHFGPRLLDNFMQDRGNQVTLGMFVATFLYCLLVLRTVRSVPQSFDPAMSNQVFVPHLSVFLAVGLALASVAVLIYFIHHVPESIYISNVLHRISDQISLKVDELYPDMLGDPNQSAPVDIDAIMQDASAVACHGAGYLQGVDDRSLLELAEKHDLIIELLVRPGDYLLASQPIARFVHRDKKSTNPETSQTSDEEKLNRGILRSLAIGVSRTPTQDLHFLTDQFVEIATRALSPGVNDPFTANQCIDQLIKALGQLSTRSLPTRFRRDTDGELRIITTETCWQQIVGQMIQQLIPYVNTDTNVQHHLQQRINQLLTVSENQTLNNLLREVSKKITQNNE